MSDVNYALEDLTRAERKGYCLGFAAGYSLFDEAVTELLKDLKGVVDLEETSAFKKFKARWMALYDTRDELLEEAVRMDVVDHYRSHEAYELKKSLPPL